MLDEELELDGAPEPLAGGVLLAPLDALPEGEDVLGEVLIEPLALDEPPEAESFFVASADEEDELDDGLLGTVALPDTEPDAEPGGVVGVVLEPADDEAPEPGAVEVLLPALSPQAATPRAKDTAAAKIESLIDGPPWLGYQHKKQGARPSG